MILADLRIGGKMRQVILHAPKNGFFFVIDRTDGQFISAKNFVDVNWATGYEANGRPIEIAGSAIAAAARRHSGTLRRTQLAADVVQSPDGPGVSAGAERAGQSHG